MLSILPPALTKILSVLGFDADREQGLLYLRQVHDYGGRNYGNATFMLCLNYLFIPRALQGREKNLIEVKPILERTQSILSESGFFRFINSHYCLKSGDVSGAIENLQQAINILNESMGSRPHNLLFELASCQLITFNFEKASEVLQQLLESEKEFDTKGISALALAVCKIKLGDKDGANQLIKNLEKYTSKNSRIDKFTLEKIDLFKQIQTEDEKHLLALVSVFQIMYLRRDLANLTAQYAEPLYQMFVEVCSAVKTDEKSKIHGDIQSGIAVVKGQFLRQIGKREESQEEFKRALTFDGKIKYEKQWVAFSYYEIAESIYLNEVSGETNATKKIELLNEVKKNLEKCNKLSGYPFEEVLHSRAKLAQKQVDAEIKETKK